MRPPTRRLPVQGACVVILPCPDLAHAALYLLWFVQRGEADRPEVTR